MNSFKKKNSDKINPKNSKNFDNQKMNKKMEVKCFALNDFGEGIFKNDKTIGCVANLLPKEKAIVEEVNSKLNKTTEKKYRLVKLLNEASDRITVKCDVYKRCGSCHLLHMNYDKQIEFKYNYVTNALKEQKLNSKIDEVIKAEKKERYRNKMQVAYTTKIENNRSDIVYGFYAEDTHKIIPLNDCLVHSERQNEIVKSIARIIKELKLIPYDEDKRTGLIRFVLVREAIKSGEILVAVVTNGEIFPARSEFVKRLRNKCPYITTIVQNVNSRKTSIILGDDERVLYGPGYIIDQLCGINFKISSKTFYQVNPYQTEKLYNKVIEYANLSKNDVVLDAYCGVGTIGMVMAPHAGLVIGVENNKQSVINARDNAYQNKVKNIRFVNQEATEFLEKDENKYDVVVMDPPRSGSTVKFLQTLKKIAPKKIVYVSCEAKTLARDLKELVDKYDITKKCIVDMFVGTYHVETVCLLTKK